MSLQNSRLIRLMLIVFVVAVSVSLPKLFAQDSWPRFRGVVGEEIDKHASIVRRLVTSEELLLKLTPRLRQLDRAAFNLQLPDHQAQQIFADRVEVVSSLTDQRVKSPSWNIAAKTTSMSRRELHLLNPLFESVRYFEQAEFKFVRGKFLPSIAGDEFGSLLTDVQFDALAYTKTARWRAVQATFQLRWQRQSPLVEKESGDSHWKIDSWRVQSLQTYDTDRLMFRESLDGLIQGPSQQQARESEHWRYAVRHYYPGLRAKLDGEYGDRRFFPISTSHHPGVTVADIDGNGFDDIYVSVRFGKNLYFRNNGKGSLEEAANRFGLDVDGRSNGSVFADFDNDGDLDAMIARSLERSIYLVNEGGQFRERSYELISFPMPYEATSVSAVDVNQDGLLDVYFSTYHQDDISRRIDADLSHPEHRIHQLLTGDQSRELKKRFTSEHRSYINQVGPPNVLLINQGEGRFAVADQQSQVAIWRNSFQATWCDFDDDGDVDLYVANDFASDQLLRNDQQAGFVDVTSSLGMTQLGFGMGVSWGDYDNDGRQDLYVSNMYSKAGLRIADHVDQLDPRIAQLATGNYLFKNLPANMKLVSGLSAHGLPVAKAGWSWGGQFADFDCDGFLDLYVPNGYYSVPGEFSTDVDL